MTQLAQLQAEFSIPDIVDFSENDDGVIFVNIHNSYASAQIALQGAHVTAFQPHNDKAVLWMSQQAVFKPGKAIRGGIPVCWPWFANHPTDSDKPAHGFARIFEWTLERVTQLETGETRIVMSLQYNEQTLALWPNRFKLQLNATIGRKLRVDLIAYNVDEKPFAFGGALHSYYAVSDVTEASVRGLESCVYIDKLDSRYRKVQHGAIKVNGEMDRIYLDTTNDCVIEDPLWQRSIRIAKHGSRTTVAWNPWQEKVAAMSDFGDDEYRDMVCIETTNICDDVVLIRPGENHSLVAIVSTE